MLLYQDGLDVACSEAKFDEVVDDDFLVVRKIFRGEFKIPLWKKLKESKLARLQPETSHPEFDVLDEGQGEE